MSTLITVHIGLDWINRYIFHCSAYIVFALSYMSCRLVAKQLRIEQKYILCNISKLQLVLIYCSWMRQISRLLVVCFCRNWENVFWEENIVFRSTCRLTAKTSLRNFLFWIQSNVRHSRCVPSYLLSAVLMFLVCALTGLSVSRASVYSEMLPGILHIIITLSFVTVHLLYLLCCT